MNLREIVSNSIGMRFAFIPAGEFIMGAPSDEEDRDPKLMFFGANEPQHLVHITKPFMFSVTSVTQGQWHTMMGTTVCQLRDKHEPSRPLSVEGEQYPMYYVSWEDAVKFCEQLGRKDGQTYRLPTEAEWEYACRAGTTTAYCSGNGLAALKEVGCFSEYKLEDGNRGNTLEPKPAASFNPNAWGLYDMHGNILEWCSDWYRDYTTDVMTDPTGASTGKSRVVRGGSFNSLPTGCRSAHRTMNNPQRRQINIGFRVVLEAKHNSP